MGVWRRIYNRVVKMKAIRLSNKGEKTILRETKLKDLQNAVGGYVEAVYLNKTPFEYEGIKYDVMLCNEDGQAMDLPINSEATRMYHSNTLPNTHIIVGDVVFTSREVWN